MHYSLLTAQKHILQTEKIISLWSLLEWEGNGILALTLVILQHFNSQKIFAWFIFSFSFAVMWLIGFSLQAAGRSTRECCWFSIALSEKGYAPPKSTDRGWKQSILTPWSSVTAFLAHYMFVGAIWCIGVYFIALHRFLVCSSRVVHLYSGNSWHLLFWLGLEHLTYMHQKMKNQDIDRRAIPFRDYLRHSREVRPKITYSRS